MGREERVILILLVLVVAAYLLGSIPTGYWIVKAVKGVDLLKIGSRSTGATNVLRAAGKGWAATVLALDAVKGYVPVYAAVLLSAREPLASLPLAEHHLVPPVVALAALVGHSLSIFLGFKGGKSAATGLGTLLGLQPLVGWSTFAFWIFLVWSTRYVSLASIVAVICCGGFMWLSGAPASYVGYCVLSAVYVVWRHKANVKRLLEGTEPRFGEKPKEVTGTQGDAGSGDGDSGNSPGPDQSKRSTGDSIGTAG